MQSDPRVRFRSAGRSPGRSACPHWRRSTESRVAEPPDALRKWGSYVNLDRHFCRHCCQSPRRDAEPPENWPTLNLNQPHFENDQPVVLITEEFVRLDVVVEMKLGPFGKGREPQHIVGVKRGWVQDVDGQLVSRVSYASDLRVHWCQHWCQFARAEARAVIGVRKRDHAEACEMAFASVR